MTSGPCEGCRKRAKIIARGASPGVTICDCDGRERAIGDFAHHPACNCGECRWARISDFFKGA